MGRSGALLGALLWLGCSANAGGGAGIEPAGEGEMCGGFAAIPCVDGLWCDPEPGLCKGADVAGTCVVVPQICTRDYRPVCGCDGRTYGNECERRSARAQKDRDGECEG